VTSSSHGDQTAAPSPLRALTEVAGTAARSCTDLRTVSDDVLLAELDALEAAQRQLDSARLALIGELDARRASAPRTGLTTRRWLAHHFGVPGRHAWHLTTTARTLRDRLPLVAAALRRGRLTVHHADLLAVLRTDRTQAHLIDLQSAFIDLAQRTGFDEWERQVRDTLRLLDADGPEPGAERDHAAASRLMDGGLRLLLELHAPESTEAVLAAVEVELDARVRHHRRLLKADPSHVVPGRARLRAEAVTELILRGHAARHRDLRAPSADVTLVVQAGDPLHARTLDGVRLSDSTTRLLCCDASWHAVVVDSLGMPIDMGRRFRFFTPGQRRAILTRDGGCVHPGCRAPARWVHVHHLLEWDDDGRTDLRNGVTLCPTHHGLWHQPGWSAVPDPDDLAGFLITTPTGAVLRSQRHRSPRPDPATCAAVHAAAGTAPAEHLPAENSAAEQLAAERVAARTTLTPQARRALRRAVDVHALTTCSALAGSGDHGGNDPPLG
jgi:hypothetical protein